MLQQLKFDWVTFEYFRNSRTVRWDTHMRQVPNRFPVVYRTPIITLFSTITLYMANQLTLKTVSSWWNNSYVNQMFYKMPCFNWCYYISCQNRLGHNLSLSKGISTCLALLNLVVRCSVLSGWIRLHFALI